MIYPALEGIVAAPFLPMNPDFSIDWTSLRSYIGWIAGQRPTAIAMNMDASEGPSLSRDEQLAEMEWFINAAEPFAGMEINVLSETIPTHSYESETLTRAFEEITGIRVNHQLLGEGEGRDRPSGQERGEQQVEVCRQLDDAAAAHDGREGPQHASDGGQAHVQRRPQVGLEAQYARKLHAELCDASDQRAPSECARQLLERVRGRSPSRRARKGATPRALAISTAS